MGVALHRQINWMKTRKMHKNKRRRDGGPRCAWVTCGAVDVVVAKVKIFQNTIFDRLEKCIPVGYIICTHLQCEVSFTRWRNAGINVTIASVTFSFHVRLCVCVCVSQRIVPGIDGV